MDNIEELINEELNISEGTLLGEEFPTDLEHPYADFKRLGRKIVIKGNEMEIYYQFGKNGEGITKELALIGNELENFSKEGWWLVLEDPHFDETDDVYDFKVFGRKDGVNESATNSFIDTKLFKKKAKIMLSKGVSKNVIIGLLAAMFSLTAADDARVREILKETEQELVASKETPFEDRANNDWILVSTDAVATVHNAHPSQCNNDCFTTASGFKLDKDNINAHRVIAMERTYMKELGLNYGDVVKIVGTGKYDGVWQIQDTMNKRFAGQHKIDILTTNKYGKWDRVDIYKLSHPEEYTEYFRNKMLGSK